MEEADDHGRVFVVERIFTDNSQDEFWGIRGKAIQAYANVEQALFSLFVELTEMRRDMAGIIFFKIVNAGTLYAILEKLLRKKHGDTYSLFSNSFLKILRHELSDRRNHIVHWNAVRFADSDGPSGLGLTPPNLSDYGPNTPPLITSDQMIEFIEKCNFFAKVGFMFASAFDPNNYSQMGAAQAQAWRDIFLQPVVYPPPDTHPTLSRPRQQAPGTLPPPSPS